MYNSCSLLLHAVNNITANVKLIFCKVPTVVYVFRVEEEEREQQERNKLYFRRVVQTLGSSLCVCKSLSNKMSKRLATSTDDGASNNTEQSATNANQGIINLDDSDDDDDDMQFVGIVHPAMPTIDLCVSPSTSAAAAAAAAVSATATAAAAAPSTPAAAEALKTANIETGTKRKNTKKKKRIRIQTKTITLHVGACLFVSQ